MTGFAINARLEGPAFIGMDRASGSDRTTVCEMQHDPVTGKIVVTDHYFLIRDGKRP